VKEKSYTTRKKNKPRWRIGGKNGLHVFWKAGYTAFKSTRKFSLVERVELERKINIHFIMNFLRT